MIAITVEEEDDIAKFKGYEAPKGGAADGGKKSSASPPPMKEVAEKPASSPQPNVSKAVESSKAGDRIFSSPLAKKLAKDHNVSHCIFWCKNFITTTKIRPIHGTLLFLHMMTFKFAFVMIYIHEAFMFYFDV